MTVDETTRTPNPDGGDAAATQTTGTQGEEGRDAPKGDDLSKLNLEWKGKAESLNALLAAYGVSSVGELNERLAQSPAAQVETSPAADDGIADLRVVEALAAEGNSFAKVLLRQAQRNDDLARGVGDAFVARDIQDPRERAQALALYKKYPERFGDLEVALAAVRAPKLAAENARLAAEIAKLKKPPDPDVINAPRTHGQETPAPSTTKRKMTGAQFDAEVASLRAEGKHRSALDLQRAYADGDIVLGG